MPEEHVDGRGDGRGEVLRLAVGSHDPGVAADAEVVLRRDATGVVDGLLAGEHHRAVGRHHEDPAGVHQHRRLGVPVRLRPDVDAGDDHVDLAACLRVLDEAPQHTGDPVEVLAAGVHGDLGAGGEREPLDRHVQRRGQVDGGDDPPALGFGDRAHRLRGVAEHGHAGDAVRLADARRVDHPDHDGGDVAARRAVDRREPSVGVEIVLCERAAAPGEQRGELVGVDEAAPARLDALAGVVVERLHRRRRRFGDPHRQPVARLVAEAHDRVERLLRRGHQQAGADHDLLQSEPLGQRRQPTGDRVDLVERQVDDRPDVQQHAVPVESRPVGVVGPGAADRVEAAGERQLDLWNRHGPPGVVADRRHAADLGNGDEATVGRVVPGHAVVGVHIVDRGQADDLEVRQPPHLQAPRDHRVQAAELAILGEALWIDAGSSPRHPVRSLAVGGGTSEREHLGRHVLVRVDRHHCDAADRHRQLGGVEIGHEPGGELLGGRVLVGWHHQVEIDDRGVGRGDRCRRSGDGRERGTELGRRRAHGEDCDGAVVAPVVRGDDVEIGRAVDRHRAVLADLVVAARQHREQRAGSVCRREQPTCLEHRCQRECAGDERLLVRGGDGRLGSGIEHGEHVAAHRCSDLVAVAVDQRPVEEPMASAPRDARQDRVATLRRLDDPVEGIAEAVGRTGVDDGATLQDRGDDGELIVDVLLGDEDPHQRVLEPGTDGQPIDPVVGDGAFEPLDEPGGQALALDVECPEVVVEVLARGTCFAVIVWLPAIRRERAEIGKGVQHRDQLIGGATRRERRRRPPGDTEGNVVAEDERAHGLRRTVGGRRLGGHGNQPVERDRRSDGFVCRCIAGGFDAQERGPAVDLDVAGDEHIADGAADRSGDADLHLHRFDHSHPLTGDDGVARAHLDADHQGAGRRPQDAGIVAREPMGDAVDLDEVTGPVVRRHHREALTRDRQRAAGAAERRALGEEQAVGGAEHERLRTDLAHEKSIRGGAVAQLDLVAMPGVQLWAAAARPAEEALSVDRVQLVGGVEGGSDERHVGVARGHVGAGSGEPVEPAGVDLTAAHLRSLEQVEQERLVRRPTTDDDDHLGERTPQPCQRLVAVAPGGDHLGDHRVVLGWDHVAFGDAGVDPNAGPDRQHQRLDRPRRRSEAALRVLGVEARFDGIAGRRRHRSLEAPAGGDVQLQLDEIEPGRQLGHRMFHLQAGVDLEEGELPPVRLVQELDGAGVGVAGERSQAHGGRPQLGVLLVRQGDAVRLLDHLLVAPLQAAVANAGRPHGAVVVGDQLHLDVPCVGDHPLDEHGRVAERLAALRPRALERSGELIGVVDPANAAATATGGRLDHQRIADARGDLGGVLDRLDRTTAPRRHRHVGPLGQQLGADLVAERPHHFGARPDEDDAEAVAELGELRPLGDEAPPDPGGVGAGGEQGTLEAGEVEIRRAGATRSLGVETDRLVGLADEHRRPLGGGVQGDRAQFDAGVESQLAHGVDQPHRRLAAVDDGDAPQTPQVPDVHRPRIYAAWIDRKRRLTSCRRRQGPGWPRSCR